MTRPEELKPGWRVVKFGDVVRKVNDKVDPETALRGAAGRFRARVEEAERISDEKGFAFADLSLEEQERYYRAAKERLARSPREGAR